MRLTFIGYSNNGLGNQFYSLQLLAGFAGLFKNDQIDLVWNDNGQSIQNPQTEDINNTDVSKLNSILDSSNPSLFDLVDFSYDNVVIHPNDLYIKDRLNVNMVNTQHHFMNCTEDETNIDIFASGKKQFKINDELDNILTLTLIPYSRFFFNRTIEMDESISRLKFKQPYVELADKVSKSLGRYNGTHIRIMYDHHQYYKFTKENFDAGIEKFNDKSLPIICSVDNFDNPILSNSDYNLISLENVILENFAEDFKALPFHNEIVLALISMLVMVKSEDFVATPRSTFGNMIFQLRNNIIDESYKYYPGSGSPFDVYDKDYKPYSWSKNAQGITWERDWVESKLRV